MGFHNRLRYGQAHSRPRYPVALIFAPIKLGKNVIDFRFFDSRPHIRNMKKLGTILFLNRNRDRFPGRGV